MVDSSMQRKTLLKKSQGSLWEANTWIMKLNDVKPISVLRGLEWK